jgi:hypothetical protein
VAVAGDHAYLADEAVGLAVVSFEDPAKPTQTGAVATSVTAMAVAVSGDHAYVTGAQGIEVIDISDPMDPRVVGRLDLPGDGPTPGPTDLALKDNFAFVVGGNPAFQVIDIADPSDPKKVGDLAYQDLFSMDCIALWGNYAFAGWKAIYIADPTNPRISGYFEEDTYTDTIVDVVVDGARAYLVDEYCCHGEFGVVDISTSLLRHHISAAEASEETSIRITADVFPVFPASAFRLETAPAISGPWLAVDDVQISQPLEGSYEFIAPISAAATQTFFRVAELISVGD